MEQRSSTFGERYFEISKSTWHFFGLTFATMGFYSWYHVYQIAKVLQHRDTRARDLPLFTIIAISVSAWSVLFTALPPIWLIYFLVYFLACIVPLSIKMCNCIDKMFAENGLDVKMNKFFTCILLPIYLYYKIRNAEEESAHNKQLLQVQPNASNTKEQQ